MQTIARYSGNRRAPFTIQFHSEKLMQHYLSKICKFDNFERHKSKLWVVIYIKYILHQEKNYSIHNSYGLFKVNTKNISTYVDLAPKTENYSWVQLIHNFTSRLSKVRN